MLRPGGVVVFDDWRSEHTPGVRAAVWESVFTDGLIPVVVTPAPPASVDSDLVQASLTAALDDRLTQWTNSFSRSVGTQVRHAAIDASSITRA